MMRQNEVSLVVVVVVSEEKTDPHTRYSRAEGSLTVTVRHTRLKIGGRVLTMAGVELSTDVPCIAWPQTAESASIEAKIPFTVVLRSAASEAGEYTINAGLQDVGLESSTCRRISFTREIVHGVIEAAQSPAISETVSRGPCWPHVQI
jgi:hypothetical protein